MELLALKTRMMLCINQKVEKDGMHFPLSAFSTEYRPSAKQSRPSIPNLFSHVTQTRQSRLCLPESWS